MYKLKRAAVKNEFSGSAVELLQSTTRQMMLAVLILVLVLQIFLAATFPSLFQWSLIPTTALILASCGLGIFLLERCYLAALIAWLIGVGAGILLAGITFQRAEILFLLAFLPFMAVITIGWTGGAAFGAGITALGVWLMGENGLLVFPVEYAWGIGLASLFGGIIGWSATNAMITGLEWSMYSYKQAWENLQETRQHRAQLSRLMKNLDQTHYQLERANTSLVAAWRAASEAERLKTEFVANVSHELRTPLNLIIGYSEIMALSPESYGGEPLPGAYRSDIHAIYNSARHLRDLVDDVLDLGRIENDRIILSREDVHPQDLIEEVCGMVRDYIGAKGIDFQVDTAKDLPVIRIDRLRIRQALLNLLVNAARFTDQGFIRLEVSQNQKELVFKVQDTGRGISEQDLPHIFDPFYTTGPGRESGQHAGSGLGLPISKKFIELHNGKIWVESALHHGATFTFTLPIENRADFYHLPRPSEYYLPGAQLRDSEKMVVVVSDDPLMVSMLQRHMGGFRFAAAESFTEGRQLAEQVKAVAMILPHGSLPEGQASPVPLIQIPFPSTRQAAAAMGAVDFLVKPVAAQQLLSALERIEQAADKPIGHILIADDDPELVRLFRRTLRARFPAQDILEAYNGEEALLRMKEELPDLILLDLFMPQGDGRSVISAMKQDARLAEIPVVIVSGEIWREGEARFPGALQAVQPGGFALVQMLNLLEVMLKSFSAGWEDLTAKN